MPSRYDYEVRHQSLSGEIALSCLKAERVSAGNNMSSMALDGQRRSPVVDSNSIE